MKKWTRALYQPNLPLDGERRVTSSEAHIALAQRAAREGMVLLKNENRVLPLKRGAKLAAFGKGLYDMVKGGGGSGDVHCIFTSTLAEGLEKEGVALHGPTAAFYDKYVREQYAAGADPGMMREAAIDPALLKEAAAYTDTALVAISRFSAEGWDRSAVEYEGEYNLWAAEVSMPKVAAQIYPEGDFYLTAEEWALIEAVCGSFAHVIVTLNTGGIMDTSWIRDNARIEGALLIWQAGMTGGYAAAELLTGAANPCGHLPDSFAASLTDYPSTEHFHDSPHYVEYTEDVYVGYRYFETIPFAGRCVVYPFGFGLSYTTFSLEMLAAKETDDATSISVRVTNTGDVAGREVAAVYYSAPQGVLGRPNRELGAFAKTALLAPGESETVELVIPKRLMAAFDDLGRVAAHAWVLEAGAYRFYLGTSVRDAEEIAFTWNVPENIVLEQLSPKLVPNALPERLRSDGTYEALPTGPVPDMNACAFEKMVPGSEEALMPATRQRGQYMLLNALREGARGFREVAEGNMTLDEFAEQLTDDELIELTGGAPNTGVANTCGIGGLSEVGVPAAMTADGPAGVRISPDCGIPTTAWPCETLLASTWDEALLTEIGAAAGAELKENNLSVWLAPAMNIHRNPMCGRNFEYFSEDSLLTGKMAAAEVRGIQSNQVAACIKHFAFNNKETNRKHSDSRVSERAAREIYLRGFEIAVRESDPWAVMSAYNSVNGQRCAESRELLTDILRGEWGYQGLVMSDWWNRSEHYKELLAGEDVKMATGFPDRVRRALDMGVITRDDLLPRAKKVLELLLRLD